MSILRSRVPPPRSLARPPDSSSGRRVRPTGFCAMFRPVRPTYPTVAATARSWTSKHSATHGERHDPRVHKIERTILDHAHAACRVGRSTFWSQNCGHGRDRCFQPPRAAQQGNPCCSQGSGATRAQRSSRQRREGAWHDRKRLHRGAYRGRHRPDRAYGIDSRETGRHTPIRGTPQIKTVTDHRPGQCVATCCSSRESQ